MPRHEAWREQYRSSPYLKTLTKSELLQRLKDLVANTVILDGEGRGSLRSPHAGDDLMIRFTHVLEEFVRRGESYDSPGMAADIQFPKPRTVDLLLRSRIVVSPRTEIGTSVRESSQRRAQAVRIPGRRSARIHFSPISDVVFRGQFL